MPAFRPLDYRATSLLIAFHLSFAPVGCGDDAKDAPAGVPDLTKDYGSLAYEFVTAQADGGLTRILLHSNGEQAVLLILEDGAIDRARSARAIGRVRDAATLELTEGQVNLDANGTFADNDLVPAKGYVLLAQQEIASNDLAIGSVAQLAYTFRAVLSGTANADVLAPLFDPA
ncbi:MAG: hypothetical protein IPK07_22805 [Deltaproteobacteria bacterium]|nr:hypothetical protein [Deltaproteobacteria bacterium]